MKRFLFASILLFFLIPANTNAQPKWRPYTSPGKTFTVELPWKPIYQRKQITGMVPNSAGPFKGIQSVDYYNLNMYIDEGSTSFFIFEYEVADKRSDQDFDIEVDSIMSGPGGKDKNYLQNRPVTVNGLHGQEYFYEKGKTSARVLVINAGHRIFLLRFSTEEKKGINRGPVEKVFSTFQPSQ